MIYLLDTHYLLWAIADPGKISRNIKGIITDPAHRILVSTISFWEAALKSSLGKLDMSGFSPEDLPDTCLEMGFEILQLSSHDCSSYHNLKAVHHKDPFDRMLIWQAIRHNYILISVDNNVKKYKSEGLKIFSE
jgi:PIN domain nuclease of toxin-antitoxin system